jgi:hypothetical protein
MKIYSCWDFMRVQSNDYNIGLKLFKNSSLLKKYNIEFVKNPNDADYIFYFMNMGWNYYKKELDDFMWTGENDKWSQNREEQNIKYISNWNKKIIIYLRGDGASPNKFNIQTIAMNDNIHCVLHDFHLKMDKVNNPVNIIKDYHHLYLIKNMTFEKDIYDTLNKVTGCKIIEMRTKISWVRKEIWNKKFKPFTFLFDNYGWLYKNYDKNNHSHKEYDIFYVKNTRPTLDGLLREKTRDILYKIPNIKKMMDKCKKNEYDIKLAKSKICISTWGMGECVYDDWKALLNETILLKIDTSHVIDYYGIYNEENGNLIYYKQDLSDLKDKINHILENYDYYLKKAKEAKKRLLEFTEEQHIKDFSNLIRSNCN